MLDFELLPDQVGLEKSQGGGYVGWSPALTSENGFSVTGRARSMSSWQ